LLLDGVVGDAAVQQDCSFISTGSEFTPQYSGRGLSHVASQVVLTKMQQK
jgi:hypothetical protein